MKYNHIILLSALLCASCVKEPFLNENGNSVKQELTSKLVGSATTDDATSILVCISGDIETLQAKEEFKGLSFEPVFAGADTPSAKKHNLHLWYNVTFDESMNLKDVAGLLASAPEIRKIQYDCPIPQPEAQVMPLDESITKSTVAQSSTNDPYFPEQWSLYNSGTIVETAVAGADIAVSDAWNLCSGSSDIIVAIIDSGIDYDAEDLKDCLWKNTDEIEKNGKDDDGNGYVDDIFGYNFIENSGLIEAYKEGEGAPGHGTHVAGIIGAARNNGIGIAGIAGGSGKADGVRLMSCQIFYGSKNPTVSKVAAALKYAADNGACIASCSFGSPAGKTYYYDSDNLYKAAAGVEYDAIQYFIDPENANCSSVQGNIIVSSTGNSGINVAGYPGALKDVIGVSAYGPDNLPTSYTNYGPGTNISAPGGEYPILDSKTYKGMILSTIPNGLKGTHAYDGNPKYGYMQGTSQACPHVSGVAALGMSYAHKLGKHFTRDEFISMLLSSTNNMNSLLSGTKQTKKVNGSTYVAHSLNLDNYYGKMGTGSVDAWKFLMQIEGTPSVMIKAGEAAEITLTHHFGGHSADLKYIGVDVSYAAAASLGLESTPVVENGILKLTCTKVGSGKIIVRAIAGGDTLGGGDSIGGMEASREISIVSRPLATQNGGWL